MNESNDESSHVRARGSPVTWRIAAIATGCLWRCGPWPGGPRDRREAQRRTEAKSQRYEGTLQVSTARQDQRQALAVRAAGIARQQQSGAAVSRRRPR